jgi:hypothetical protein
MIRDVMNQRELGMKRFLIQVNGEGSYYDPMKQVFYLNEEEFADFISIVRDLELFNDFNKNTIISCELCNSSIISAKYFHHFIRKAFDRVSRSRRYSEKYPGMDMLYEDLSIICSHLMKGGALSLTGMPDMDSVREGAEELTDTGGDSSVFAYEELGIIIDSNCTCYSIVAQ